ncbi:hypothetical protein ONE63_011592 [Megalurothrips usitatus]|uniref:Reverse transcriptase domain-containing protein n=1 Tax=Megalurothrips usitatus TaxID=439358 RepID=A0AAV7X1G2_9NEOP|nr:hypothetical protein ONE63_011592 [Megalurothrips usitatus]
MLIPDTPGPVMMGGDWNCVVRKGDTTGVATPCPVLTNIVKALDMKDAWLQLRPRKPGYTYHNAVCASRLDRWYVNGEVKLKDASLHACAASDHLGVLVHVEADSARPPRHPDRSELWKCDPAALKSREFMPAMDKLWSSWRAKKGLYKDEVEWWEEGKKRTKVMMQKLTADIRREDKEMLKFLQGCLNERCIAQDRSQAAREDIQDLKARITEILSQRLAGVAVRAKLDTAVDGEAVGVQHVAECIRRRRTNHIGSLEDERGEVLTDERAIAEHVRGHLAAVLGTENDTEAGQEAPGRQAASPAPARGGETGGPTPQAPASTTPLLDGVVCSPVMTGEDSDAMLGPVTKEDVLAVLKDSPRGRSPGQDGLTVEFYTEAWDVVGDDLTGMINAVIKRRRVGDSHREGVIVLVPKVSKPVRVGDLRPVTLVNVDGKLVSRIMARRMTGWQGRLLHPTQVRGGADRNIHGALADVRDVVSVVGTAAKKKSRKKKAGSEAGACVVALDISGAFNTVKWDYMWRVLRMYGVGESVIELIKSMYEGATTRVRVNGRLTAVFRPRRGIRQGCPWSMLLFNVVIAPLLRALSGRLRGVCLPVGDGGGEAPRLAVSGYVDDVVAVLERPDDVPVLTEILEAFGEESGLRVNKKKSQALPVGGWKTSTPMVCPYSDTVKVLGIVFTREVGDMLQANWEARRRALKMMLVDARLRAFNVVQRARYANTYVLPLLWHLATVVPLNKNVVDEVKQELGAFLWVGYPLRVKFDAVVLPADRGGLGLHHPGLKAQALFVGRWMTAARSTEVTLAGGWLNALESRYPAGRAIPNEAKHARVVRQVKGAVRVDDGVRGGDLNRALYAALLEVHAERPAAVPRVVSRTPGAGWPVVWRRVHAAALEVDARASWYRVCHDVIPTKARMRSTRRADSDKCVKCEVPDSLTHHLVGCGPSRRRVWAWVAAKLAALLDRSVAEVDARVLLVPDFQVDGGGREEAAVWLCGMAVHYLITRATVEVGGFERFMRQRRKEAEKTGRLGENLKRL